MKKKYLLPWITLLDLEELTLHLSSKISNISLFILSIVISIIVLIGSSESFSHSRVDNDLEFYSVKEGASFHSIIEEFGEIISFEALKSSSIVGKKLKDIKLPKDVSLGAIVKENQSILSPRGITIIEAGDIVVMFVPVKSMKKVEELLSVNLDFF